MRQIIMACLVVAAAAACAVPTFAYQAGDLDTRTQGLKEKIEVHIERVKRAREIAGHQMTLSRIRLEAQLLRSQEDLMRQVEALEHLSTHLTDQMSETGELAAGAKNESRQNLRAALADIEGQLRQTNELLKGMEAITRTNRPREAGEGFPQPSRQASVRPDCRKLEATNSEPVKSNPEPSVPPVQPPKPGG